MKNKLTSADIKKILYKTKPTAHLFASQNDNYFYDCVVDNLQIMFIVPISEMGEKPFKDKEPAQLLIRWYDKHYTL